MELDCRIKLFPLAGALVYLCQNLHTSAMNQIILKPNREKPILNKHCWIFSGSVEQVKQPDSVGIAEVCDANGRLLGFGFSDPGSQILCRMFHFGEAPTTGFGPDYWRQKFHSALALRQKLIFSPQTNACRLIHAEGDFFPGLVVDAYGPKTAVVHTLIKATHQWIGTWVSLLAEWGYTHIYHKKGQDEKGSWIGEGSPAAPVRILENGLQFEAEIEIGQKTGFFLDQRENRKIIGHLSKGKKVLNAFSFSGGFSVYAIQGGARQVDSVDISGKAVEAANHNVSLNFPDFQQHKGIKADCFEFLKSMDADYDLIILDPPAFAKSKAHVEKAARGYKEINLSALRKMASRGLLATFSCSQHIDRQLFQQIVFSAAVDSGRQIRIVQMLDQPADHPINIFHPESAYLKGLLLLVD